MEKTVKLAVALYNKNTNGTDQVLAENNKTVNLKTGQTTFPVLKPVPTDGSSKTNESTGI